MENQKATALENMEVFGVEKVENFTSMRTREGDLLIMKAHELAKKEIKSLYPDIKVGLTLSLHDIQPQAGGEERARKEWDEEFLHYLPYILRSTELYTFSHWTGWTVTKSGRRRAYPDEL